MKTCIFLLLFIISSNLFPYIDPGTGSALFSVLLAILGTLFFLLKAFIIKIKTFSFAINKDKNINKKAKIIIYGEDKRYYNLFKPIVEELIKLQIPTVYYSMSEDDGIFNIESKYLHTEYIGTGNKAYAKLNFIEADICLMTTPNLDVFQLKKSKGVKKYIHIVHSPAIPLYKLYSLDFFDCVLINGPHQEEYIRELEKIRNEQPKEIVIVGSSYLDELEIKKQSIDNTDNNYILLSPSWGAEALLSRYGSKLIDKLMDFNIIIRPHPQSLVSEKDIIKKLQKQYEFNENVEWDFNVDNIYSFSRAKIMISDFSGVIFDYIFLFEKPVLVPQFKFNKSIYDASVLEDEIWTFKVLPKITLQIEEQDLNNIKNIIYKNVNNIDIIKNIRDIKKQAYMHQGECGYRTAYFIRDKLININKDIIS